MSEVFESLASFVNQGNNSPRINMCIKWSAMSKPYVDHINVITIENGRCLLHKKFVECFQHHNRSRSRVKLFLHLFERIKLREINFPQKKLEGC